MVFEAAAVSERNPNRDEETGQYAEGYTAEAALQALGDLDGAATTTEIADELGCARRTAYNKLLELEDRGEVSSRTPGRTRLWIVATEE